ncbi:MAG: sulfur carrier protein ThiS [Methanobrevibacter sp.]|nr:sulfur carrier protein ThiS [Methanobrevibacter sp.]
MSFTLVIKDKTEEKELDGELTIKELLDELDLSSETIVSKKNGEIVIEDTIIEEGDKIEFIQIIYGG